MAGRGSAESSRAAKPRWVMMEISRVARASTAERSGSSSGACCRRNDKTSDPSRPRASTTKGISSACGFFSGGYLLRLPSSLTRAALPGVRAFCSVYRSVSRNFNFRQKVQKIQKILNFNIF